MPRKEVYVVRFTRKGKKYQEEYAFEIDAETRMAVLRTDPNVWSLMLYKSVKEFEI